MVARINHGAHVEGVLFYNKLKTDKGEARVVLCHNLPIVPQDGKIDIRRLSEAFRPWMTHPRPRLGEPVFHVSLNPNPKDRIDEMKMLEIAHYYMERMGYGDQPYVIFEHNDIERKHYHIVSSRIKPDGTTIDSFEYKKRSKALTEEIEREFNLIPTVLGQQSAAFEELRKVEYAQSNLKAQLSSVLNNLTDRYRFSSKGECTTLLKIFNIWMEECKGEVEGRPYAGIIYGALDEHGQRVGKPIKSSRISKKFGYKALQKEYSKTKRWIAGNKQKLEPTRITIREAMKTARTTEEFAAAIRPGGISVVFHRSAEHENRIYGVTFIDHRNGLVINGSRLDKAFAANRFQELFTKAPATEPQNRAERSQQSSDTENDWFTQLSHDFGAISDIFPDMDLFSVLLNEASRPDYWDEWAQEYQRRKKKKKRRHLK